MMRSQIDISGVKYTTIRDKRDTTTLTYILGIFQAWQQNRHNALFREDIKP